MKWHEEVIYSISGWLVRGLLSLLFGSYRANTIGDEIERRYFANNHDKGLLYASWHRGAIYLMYHYRFRGMVIMISASKDGEWVSHPARRFGWKVVRGSSSRMGREALREMLALQVQGNSGGLLVDAPRGPEFISKMGIVALAKRTGQPIMPVIVNADRVWRIKSWDRTIIPKPFARLAFVHAEEMIHVPADADDEACESYRRQLDMVLRKLMYQVDTFVASSMTGDPRQIPVPQEFLDEVEKRAVAEKARMDAQVRKS